MNENCWISKKSNKKAKGKTYYINTEKGISQWGKSFDTQGNMLPYGWEMYKSNSGDDYFGYKGKKFQWEKPKEEKQPLEKDWVERISKCNQIYYINTKDNTSQWNHPSDTKIIETLWPMEKMHRMYKLYGKPASKGYAVVLTTGALNPVHLGHSALIDQSIIRLRQVGYTVIGAWLSPSNDLYVQPKAEYQKTIGLSAAFRVEAARRAIAYHPLIEVGMWESSPERNYWPDFPEVCFELQKEIVKEFKKSNYSGDVTLFYACGTDHAKNTGLYNKAQPWGGVVVVPRDSEIAKPENPSFKLYVAPPAIGTIFTFSSTKVRQAIIDNKPEIVTRMVAPNEARFLLHPSDKERSLYSSDFDKLESKD
jgi:hypothetical protein